VSAWGEFFVTNGGAFAYTTNAVISNQPIEPRQAITLQVQMPSLGKERQRVSLMCGPRIRGLWQYVSAAIKALLHLEPPPFYTFEIELNQDANRWVSGARN